MWFSLLTLCFSQELLPVGAGTYRPLYPASPEEGELPVAAFLLARHPVTVQQFLDFVRENAVYQRGTISPLLADQGYLAAWKGALEPGLSPQAPVTGVSWFAARAYCEARGERLPTEAEWEWAAAASSSKADATKDPAFVAEILNWYALPSPAVLPAVGLHPPNFWGIQDLHGLVWEWVEDFNSTVVTVDNRSDGDPDRLRFCGGGAASAAAKEDYAAFMRVAFRASLQATYTTSTLGFRCARSL
ncbi:MAG TPA: formylglycine-generating enzyme family protein [Myxococcota bacterium]|nr:formylglycine-generating enzyme family protein [Myxococcota bacterium]